jgi:hypothetical protein
MDRHVERGEGQQSVHEQARQRRCVNIGGPMDCSSVHGKVLDTNGPPERLSLLPSRPRAATTSRKQRYNTGTGTVRYRCTAFITEHSRVTARMLRERSQRSRAGAASNSNKAPSKAKQSAAPACARGSGSWPRRVFRSAHVVPECADETSEQPHG